MSPYEQAWRRAWQRADINKRPHIFFAGGRWRVAMPTGRGQNYAAKAAMHYATRWNYIVERRRLVARL
jgi:hypothetical protein